MADKILFVDDEPQILDGLKRNLYLEYEVDTAVGGEEGLAAIRDRGPYAIVVSDMRMPGMNGAQFLAQVREIAPDTVRMLLTGFTDLNAAMNAVNQGNIFRFMTKPCAEEDMAKSLADGVAQHKLIRAEKELLENTLMGSIKVLTEVLSASSPEAFGRSMRIAGYVGQIVARLRLPSPWRFQAAAMLSQLGCVTLSPDLIKASYAGATLTPQEEKRFAAHPQVAREFLAHIPRLEPVAWMISRQLIVDDPQDPPEDHAQFDKDVVLGAKILKLALDLDNLRIKGLSVEQAVSKLGDNREEYGPELMAAAIGIKSGPARSELRNVAASKLETGMVLQQEIRTVTGMLVVPKGQELTRALIVKLGNYAEGGTIGKEFVVLVPR